MSVSRRKILTLLGLGAVGSSALLYKVGLRYPPLQFIPEDSLVRSDQTEDGHWIQAKGAIFQSRDEHHFRFRAFVPEPEITVNGMSNGELQVEVNNIHSEAKLVSSGSGVKEDRDGLKRTVSGKLGNSHFRWHFPKKERYRFAAIGDTGGGAELRWVLARTHTLGADFVLHLGDLNYGQGEYLGAIKAFSEAKIPSYVTIGNHDFYEGTKSIHYLFGRYLGPRNASFELGGVRFINIDTAANFFPSDGGVRGEFLRSLKPSEGNSDVVLFTHKPLTDPRHGEDSSVSKLERGFLHDEFKRLGVNSILAGHIHIKKEFHDRGIRTYISGQGLAHADLIVSKPVAEILLGDYTSRPVPSSLVVTYGSKMLTRSAAVIPSPSSSTVTATVPASSSRCHATVTTPARLAA